MAGLIFIDAFPLLS